MPKKSPATLGIIYRMPLEDLHPHPLNPYGIRDDSAMQELVGSVKENGMTVFSALPVRIGKISMTPFPPVTFTDVFWKLPVMPMP